MTNLKVREYEIEVPNEKGEDPFKNCKLKRKDFAYMLTQIVQNYSDGFVMSIDNQWGTGKTSFIRMWKQQLANDGFQTILFNAWEHDFEDGALSAILAELKKAKVNPHGDVWQKLVNGAAVIGQKSIASIIRLTLKQFGISGNIEEILTKVTEASADVLKEEIDLYTRKKDGIREFKEALTEYISDISNNKPLVFIVDELDRCRPDYAVEVLEKIKHFFSVPGVVFVLAIDKKQLEHAIQGVYGSPNIDGKEYLRKFIDVELRLPDPELEQYIAYCVEKYKLVDFFQSAERLKYYEVKNDLYKYIGFAQLVLNHKNISLRIVNRIFFHTKIALAMFRNNENVFPEILFYMILLKYSNEELYYGIKNCKYSIEQFMDVMGSELSPKNLEKTKLPDYIHLEAGLALFYSRSLADKETPFFQLEHSKNIIPTYRSRLDSSSNQQDYTSALHYYGRSDFRGIRLDYIINKIDIAPIQYY